MNKSPHDILLRPVITERAALGYEHNKYTFEVALTANKHEITEAFRKAFGVEVVSVNTVLTKGKVVRRRSGQFGKKRDVKKAIVTLAPGQVLEY